MIWVAMLATLSMAACDRNSTTAIDKIQLPMQASYEVTVPALVAYANGYFREERIEVTDFVIAPATTLRTAVMAKEFDFCPFVFEHVARARAAGSPFKAILALHERAFFSLVVRNELKDKVRTVADLRGLKVGFTTPGSGSWLAGTLFLKESGLDPEKDVDFVALNDPRVLYTALKTGKVDALPVADPMLASLLEDGVAYPLIRIWDDADHRRWIGDSKTLSGVLVTREDVIETKPDLVRRIVSAHKKALAFISSQSAATLADVILGNPRTASVFEGVDRARVITSFERIKSGFGNGCLSRAEFEIENQLAAKYNLIRHEISFEEFADTGFAGACPE